MYNIIWMQLIERLDNVWMKHFTLTPIQIEAVLAIDQELMRKDGEIEALKLTLEEIKECLEKNNPQ
jgi:hypothetical protein